MSNSLNNHRDDVMTHLKYIKEKVDANSDKLDKQNSRIRKAESSISWMKGIGTTITFVIGLLFTWFKVNK